MGIGWHNTCIMVKVTVSNYVFPFKFTYKSWVIFVAKENGFFSFNDLNIKARIEVCESSGFMAEWLYTQKTGKEFWSMSPWERFNLTLNDSTYQECERLAERFLSTKKPVEYKFGVRGGMVDRFLGSNTSATEKAQKQIMEYIDRNLKSPFEEWKTFVREHCK